MKLDALLPKLQSRKRARPTPGAPPGTLVPHPELPPPTIRRLAYGPDHCAEKTMAPDALPRLARGADEAVVWIDVQGLGDPGPLRSIGERIGLHPLTLEDIVHLQQRPKLELFDDHVFITLRGVRLAEDGQISGDQLSMVLGDGLLVTFQERASDMLQSVHARLQEGRGAIRRAGADYLAYVLIDTVIDNYFPVLERYAEVMDQLDDEVLERPARRTMNALHELRRQLRAFRRAVWPLREVLAALERADAPQVGPSARPLFRDCHDHVVQIAEFIESSLERATELSDLYLAAVSERTNQVMKVLTVIATIFIPLTFLTGLYGMNFDAQASPDNMPELKLRYGYPLFWLVALVSVVIMVWWFRRQGWIGRRDD